MASMKKYRSNTILIPPRPPTAVKCAQIVQHNMYTLYTLKNSR